MFLGLAFQHSSEFITQQKLKKNSLETTWQMGRPSSPLDTSVDLTLLLLVTKPRVDPLVSVILGELLLQHPASLQSFHGQI